MLREKGEGKRDGNDAMGRLERIRRKWMRTMGFAAADQWSALRESGRPYGMDEENAIWTMRVRNRVGRSLDFAALRSG